MPFREPGARREYQRTWVAKRRAAYMQDKSCAKCGIRHPLELDHLDPSEKVSHSIWSWSAARRDAELAKCQTLCINCHKLKTKAQRLGPAHGKGRMYTKHKCRCEPCRTWKRLSR